MAIDPLTQDEMFPDTLVPPFILSPEVADTAAQVMRSWDEFSGLRDAIWSEVDPLSIAYVLDTKPFNMAEDEWTVHAVVNVTKASPLWRSLTGYHLVVAYRQAFWDAVGELDTAERLAFLHHGLSHIDALGSKVALRPHPVEGFPWTFRRYGPLSLNDKMFFRAGSLWSEDHPSEPTPLRSVADIAEDVAAMPIVDQAIIAAAVKFKRAVETGRTDVTVSAGGRSATIKGKDKEAERVETERCPFPECVRWADHAGQHDIGDGPVEA